MTNNYLVFMKYFWETNHWQ